MSKAETQLTSSLTGLLIAAVPLIGAVLGLIIGAEDRLDLRRAAGLLIGFAGVAALLGLDFSVIDPWAVGQVGPVALGYAIGPIIIARRLSGVPALGVVAASLVVPALIYAPVGLIELPHPLPSAQVLVSVAILGVVSCWHDPNPEGPYNRLRHVSNQAPPAGRATPPARCGFAGSRGGWASHRVQEERDLPVRATRIR